MKMIWTSLLLIVPLVGFAEPIQSNDKIATDFQSHFSWKDFHNLKYRQQAEFINSLSPHNKYEFLKIYLPKSHCHFPGAERLRFGPEGQLILLTSTEDNKTRRLVASWKIDEDKLTMWKKPHSGFTSGMEDLEVWSDLTADYNPPQGGFLELDFKADVVDGESSDGRKRHYADQNIICR